MPIQELAPSTSALEKAPRVPSGAFLVKAQTRGRRPVCVGSGRDSRFMLALASTREVNATGALLVAALATALWSPSDFADMFVHLAAGAFCVSFALAPNKSESCRIGSAAIAAAIFAVGLTQLMQLQLQALAQTALTALVVAALASLALSLCKSAAPRSRLKPPAPTDPKSMRDRKTTSAEEKDGGFQRARR